jgi:exodeoxyribonuclease V alpha subunit
MEILQGTIDRFTYSDEQSGFSIVRLNTGITAVGYMHGMKTGETVELTGDWTIHPTYGKQFKFESFTPLYPDSIEGIEKYLGSGLLKGVGPVTARRLVNAFGTETFNILDHHIDRLWEVEGLGKNRIEIITKTWREHRSIKNIMVFLQSYNISVNLAIKIYQAYGNNSIQMVKENPYRLTYDIWGVGFTIADKIGKSLGFEDDNPVRLQAGIVYVLNEASNQGHVYVPKEELHRQSAGILNTDEGPIVRAFEGLLTGGHLILKEDQIYTPLLYNAERGIETNIQRLLKAKKDPNASFKINPRLPNGVYSEEQLKAIRSAVMEKMLILTGGPGTGKTTTLKGIIQAYQQARKKILLAAPTGRAAKRMSEVVGLEARTIHRLLEYNPKDNSFRYNQHQLLKADLLVLDEVSMIDTMLMYTLVRAVDNATTLILVGDVDQLPSVGAGNVLRDLIAWGTIPCVQLTQIFRQEEASDIILSAHRVNKGEFPILTNTRDGDFFFIEEPAGENIPPLIADLCLKRLPATYKFDPFRDIQVLTPMYKGDAGADNLNTYLQSILNPRTESLNRGIKKFKIGDKVLQLKNNYDKDIFNGDLGIIENFDQEEQTMKVNFGDKAVEYDFSDLDELTLAYAVSVHKSQGSEYPCVILPLTTAHYMLLQRNLLYTAITRASKLLIIIGTKQALSMAVKNNKVQLRYTSLFKLKED